MQNRPAIPNETKRELLIEVGHRCAVCGESCPLEKAHIIPWNKSENHNKENLICLCANCHQRADVEKWGEATLKEYKKTPWVMRRFKIDEIKTKSLIRISLDVEYENFGTRDKNMLIHALASFLEISPEEISIEMIEKGSTQISIKLPKESAEKLRQAHANEISEALKDIGTFFSMADMHHDIKRRLSFDIFDDLLNYCMESKCPKIVPEFHYFLIDISVEGYINEKSYFYSIDDIGKNDVDRSHLSRQRGTRMFKCPVKKPSLDARIFEIDKESFKQDICYRGAIKRKAYWNYLSKGRDNSKMNYYEALSFVEHMNELFTRGTGNEKKVDLQELEELLMNNLNIANALDMYKFCFLRQCIKESAR